MFRQSKFRPEHWSHSQLPALLAQEVAPLEMLLQLVGILEVTIATSACATWFISCHPSHKGHHNRRLTLLFLFAEEALVMVINHVTLELILVIEPPVTTKCTDRMAFGS
jgi:hypothetical protein